MSAFDDEMRGIIRRMFDRDMRRAFMTTATVPQQRGTLTIEGLLYHLAVIKQDFEEEPVAVAMRAEPGTIALIMDQMPELKRAQDPLALDGMRVEEWPLPPRLVEFVDHRGSVIKRAKI